MALVWAVEPSPFSVPVEHVGAAAALDVLPDAVDEPEAVLADAPLLLPPDEPQAARARALAMTPAATAARVSFTIGSPSSIDLRSGR